MATFPSTVTAHTSRTQDGNMDFRFGDAETVIENRTRFLQMHGILYEDHIAMRCDHGEVISLVTSFHPGVGARTHDEQIQSEVLITQEKDLALMLFTADCQPTSFYDPVTQTIALAHISRKTLCEKLPEKTITFLRDSFGTQPENLLVAIGPSIQKESYAFPLPLKETHPALAGFISERDNEAHIDLVGAHIQQLKAAGIEQKNILLSGEDTAVGEKYFSYYMMKKNGETDEARMATILVMH